MGSNRRNAIINVLFRTSSIIYILVLGIFLVPIYLKYMPVELYGYWLATGNVVTWVGDLSAVGIVMQQKVGISFGATDYKMIGKYIGSSIIISILLSFLLLIVLVIFYHFVFDWLNIGRNEYREKLRGTFIYAGVGTLLTLISFGFSGINYGLQLFKPVGYARLATDFGSVFATYLLLPFYGLYAFGISLLVRGILNFTCNIIILAIFIKKAGITIQFSKDQIKHLVGDVCFNFFAQIGSLSSKNSQLFFITKFITPEAAVIFKFTKTIPEISKYFVSVPAEALMPVFSKYLGQKPDISDVKLKISNLIYYSVWSLGLISIGFVLLNKTFITLWVGEAFYAGNAINTIIVLWVVVSSLNTNLMYTVYALGDIRRNNIMIFIQSIFLILLMLVMIPSYGIMGISLALIISETIISLVYYVWRLQKYLQFDKEDISCFLKEIASVFITIFVLYISARVIDFLPKSWFEFFGFITICATCYILGLYLASKKFRKEMYHMLFIIRTWSIKRFEIG
jgi:O-antigen/teichoic acid export membrane protein